MNENQDYYEKKRKRSEECFFTFIDASVAIIFLTACAFVFTMILGIFTK